MEKTNQGPINIGNSAGIHHPFHISTKKGKKPKTHSDIKRREKVGGSGDSGNVQEGCHDNNRIYEKSFFKFIIPGGEKRRGKRPVINLK